MLGEYSVNIDIARMRHDGIFGDELSEFFANIGKHGDVWTFAPGFMWSENIDTIYFSEQEYKTLFMLAYGEYAEERK